MKRNDTTATDKKLAEVEAKLKGLIKEVLEGDIIIAGKGLHDILAIDSSYSTSDPVLKINMLGPSVTVYHPDYEIGGEKIAKEFEKMMVKGWFSMGLEFETDYTKYLSTKNNSPSP